MEENSWSARETARKKRREEQQDTAGDESREYAEIWHVVADSRTGMEELSRGSRGG